MLYFLALGLVSRHRVKISVSFLREQPCEFSECSADYVLRFLATRSFVAGRSVFSAFLVLLIGNADNKTRLRRLRKSVWLFDLFFRSTMVLEKCYFLKFSEFSW